jgi:hypothetical protein
MTAAQEAASQTAESRPLFSSQPPSVDMVWCEASVESGVEVT